MIPFMPREESVEVQPIGRENIPITPPHNRVTDFLETTTDIPRQQSSLDKHEKPFTTYVDLKFKVVGRCLTIDHGYDLFAALSGCVPEIHTSSEIGISLITGTPTQGGKLHLEHDSQLRIRVPASKVALLCSISGQSLLIRGYRIRLGVPTIHLLEPAEKLYSRIVVIKGYQDCHSFHEAAQRQLDQLGIKGRVRISTKSNGLPDRKIIQIKQYTVVGFGLEVSGLSAEDSLKLQIKGIGGKRKMACGLFLPTQ